VTCTSGIFLNRRLILGGALVVWLLFAASFLMPVTGGMNGWEAFWMYVSEQLDVPAFWQEIQRKPLLVLTCTFSWTNATMFFAPIILWYWPRWSGLLGLLLVLGGLVPGVCFQEMVMKNELSPGFYCWVGSIFLMAGVCFWDWRGYRRNVPAPLTLAEP